nr:hypothetical protein [Tanacetum cinerariifolium]
MTNTSLVLRLTPFLRTARALIEVHSEEMILRDGDERLTLNMKHDKASYSNHPHRDSVNLINIFNLSREDCFEDLVLNEQSGNPTFLLHKEIASPEVTHEIHDSKGCTFLSEELPDIDSFNDIHPYFDDDPLSGINTYSANSLLEEEIEFLLYQGEDSDFKDSIDQSDLTNCDDLFVDPTPEMFTDEQPPDYSFPSRFDVYPDDFLEIKSDANNFDDDLFDSEGEKIKEAELLIDQLDLPCDILSEYDSLNYQDFSRDDVLPSPDNEDKVFNLGILIHEKSVKIITRFAQEKKLAVSYASLLFEDFDPPFYELLVFKEVLNSMRLLRCSSEIEEKVFKPGIYTFKKDLDNSTWGGWGEVIGIVPVDAGAQESRMGEKGFWQEFLLAVMSSASSTVTYTFVYTNSEPGRGADEELSYGGSPRVIVYGYDGLPMLPVAPSSPDYIPGPEEPQTPPAPQDEDEHEPMFIQPHDSDFVPEPIYLEYIPLDDEHILPAEEQPLPPVVSPTAESPERQAQMAETLRVIRDIRREMGDMQAELLALRTEGVVGLTRWIEKMESVFQISGYAVENQFVADETEKINRYVSVLSDNIYGSVKASKPKKLDETIELANDLMDQKLCTYVERQSNNKTKVDDSFRNNHGQQQTPKRQNVAIVYNIGTGERKPYSRNLPKCTKCHFHHNVPCTQKCHKCNKVGHCARDYRSSGNANVVNAQRNNEANPKGNGCFECGATGHFKRDCLKLKNKDRERVNAPGWVYAVGNAENRGNASRDPDSNVVTGNLEFSWQRK